MLLSQVKVLFTAVSEPDMIWLGETVEYLGGTVVQDWQQCTHVISTGIKRTAKFLCALSSGKFIVSSKWIDACKKAGNFIDPAKYFLKDPASEKKFNCNLKRSIENTQKGTGKKLFDGLQFYATPSVKPSGKDLEAILDAAGGKVKSFFYH